MVCVSFFAVFLWHLNSFCQREHKSRLAQPQFVNHFPGMSRVCSKNQSVSAPAQRPIEDVESLPLIGSTPIHHYFLAKSSNKDVVAMHCTRLITKTAPRHSTPQLTSPFLGSSLYDAVAGRVQRVCRASPRRKSTPGEHPTLVATPSPTGRTSYRSFRSGVSEKRGVWCGVCGVCGVWRVVCVCVCACLCVWVVCGFDTC